MDVTDRAERSVLAVPASNQRMIDKALASDADVVFLDLEDAVAPDRKVASRRSVITALQGLDWRGKPRLFRMNALDTPFFYGDLIEIVEEAGDTLDVIVIPKVNKPEDVYVIETFLTQLEAKQTIPRPIGLEVQIESATGLVNAHRIASASRRIEAIVFGPGDYAASIGMPVTSIGAPDEWDATYPGHRYHYAMQKILVAGRAAGIRVIDGPFADFKREDGLRQSAKIARSLGFDGKWCIHPSQIAVVNDVFSPNAEELAWAHRVLTTFEDAQGEGRGAASVGDTMIDAASVRMARSTLARERVPDR
jgi:citrate lyase beta subunit